MSLNYRPPTHKFVDSFGARPKELQNATPKEAEQAIEKVFSPDACDAANRAEDLLMAAVNWTRMPQSQKEATAFADVFLKSLPQLNDDKKATLLICRAGQNAVSQSYLFEKCFERIAESTIDPSAEAPTGMLTDILCGTRPNSAWEARLRGLLRTRLEKLEPAEKSRVLESIRVCIDDTNAHNKQHRLPLVNPNFRAYVQTEAKRARAEAPSRPQAKQNAPALTPERH